MIIALALILVTVGTIVFHFMSPWWWTPIASNWGYIDDTIIITFWVTGVVFVAILTFMAFCAYRYRYRDTHMNDVGIRTVGENQCAAALAANRVRTTESANARVARDRTRLGSVPRHLILWDS